MLENQIALITGASRGIGNGIAFALGAAGARVIGTATSGEGAAKRVFGQQPQRCSQLVGLPRSKEHAIDPIGYEFGRSPRSGCNHRQTGGHSLQNDLAKRLRDGGGVNEYV